MFTSVALSPKRVNEIHGDFSTSASAFAATARDDLLFATSLRNGETSAVFVRCFGVAIDCGISAAAAAAAPGPSVVDTDVACAVAVCVKQRALDACALLLSSAVLPSYV